MKPQVTPVPKNHPKVEFRAVQRHDDIWSIRIWLTETNEPGLWVLFCDPVHGSVTTVDQDMGWCGARSQAEAGAAQLNEMLADGRIKRR